MNLRNTFLRVLLENDEPELDPAGDKAALDAALDSSGDSNQFDIEGGDSSPEEVIAKIKKRAESWATEVNTFAERLNGRAADSLINQVQSAQKHAAFEGIADQTQKEIGKVAIVLGGLQQRINMFINVADSKFAKANEEKAAGKS